mmetsp:Transcript_6217/g.18366  ORF Transcript_6217/g.18366 Transcript_6217/m.18366 type:complete len:235 (-) Transcript_6217:651-1355(-)
MAVIRFTSTRPFIPALRKKTTWASGIVSVTRRATTFQLSNVMNWKSVNIADAMSPKCSCTRASFSNTSLLATVSITSMPKEYCTKPMTTKAQKQRYAQFIMPLTSVQSSKNWGMMRIARMRRAMRRTRRAEKRWRRSTSTKGKNGMMIQVTSTPKTQTSRVSKTLIGSKSQAQEKDMRRMLHSVRKAMMNRCSAAPSQPGRVSSFAYVESTPMETAFRMIRVEKITSNLIWLVR